MRPKTVPGMRVAFAATVLATLAFASPPPVELLPNTSVRNVVRIGPEKGGLSCPS